MKKTINDIKGTTLYVKDAENYITLENGGVEISVDGRSTWWCFERFYTFYTDHLKLVRAAKITGQHARYIDGEASEPKDEVNDLVHEFTEICDKHIDEVSTVVEPTRKHFNTEEEAEEYFGNTNKPDGVEQ